MIAESEISNRLLDWHVAMSQVAKILITNCSRTCEMETEGPGYMVQACVLCNQIFVFLKGMFWSYLSFCSVSPVTWSLDSSQSKPWHNGNDDPC